MTSAASVFSAMSFGNFSRAVSVEWNWLYADKWLQLKWTLERQDTTISNKLDMNDRLESSL